MSNSLQPHGLQHVRLPCPSPFPRVCLYSCPLSWWCHPTISSSVIPYSSCLPSFPASGSFPMSPLFALGGQRIGASALGGQWIGASALGGQWIGASALVSVLPMNEYSGLISFRTDWFDLLAFHGTVKRLLQHHIQNYQFFNTQKTIGLTIQPLLAK